MKIQDITSLLENIAPASLQENYDNAGLLTGNVHWDCTGIIISLDATEEVIEEAIANKVNLVIAHHPIIFGGLKKITGKNYVERTVIKAIKNDIAIYAIHTNLDNVIQGVNGKIADMLGLEQRQILLPKNGMLKKLSVFVPQAHAEQVRQAIFDAGAGQIGNYSECSFNVGGEGTFKAGEETNPFVGEKGQRHVEKEIRVETVFLEWKERTLIKALLAAHPYEEVAYDIYPLENSYSGVGSGLFGQLPKEMDETDFLHLLKQTFELEVIRHTPLRNKNVKKVAVCGGAGSFLTKTAIASGADVYVTADVKYHDFFDADGRIVIADIGHYESEQFTINLVFDILKEKFPTFAVLKTKVKTNPVRYFV